MRDDVRFVLMLTCFISLRITSCNRHGGFGIQKFGRNVSDEYIIW
jgi:predicted small secreted protein